MKKVLFLFSILISTFFYAQFTGEDVKYFVGEGTQTAYLIVDFKDGTDDRSYAWGFHFDEGETLSFADMLIAIDDAEPNFSHETSFGGGFLDDIIFNSHSGLASNPDWWSTWSGDTSETMTMNAGISETLVDGRWYGTSYGFSNPGPEHPFTPIPAYHSLWFSASDMITWVGEGENQSIVIVDFGTDTSGDADSFAFGIQYGASSISIQDALELIQTHVVDFSYELDENGVVEISWNGFTGTATEENPWKTYTGTDLSNWVTATDVLNVNLENGQWLGFSFGERRPFIPTDEAVEMGVSDSPFTQVQIYPNPASDIFYVDAKDISDVKIYDLTGRILKSTSNVSGGIKVNDLPKGVYVVKVQSGKSILTKKLIIR